jgi:hypothetical protein
MAYERTKYIFAGQVFGTEDEGASWREYLLPPNALERVRAVACI